MDPCFFCPWKGFYDHNDFQIHVAHHMNVKEIDQKLKTLNFCNNDNIIWYFNIILIMDLKF